MQEQLQTLTLEEAFAHELAKDVKLKGGGTAIDPDTGQPLKPAKAIAMSIMQQALKGDIAAVSFIRNFMRQTDPQEAEQRKREAADKLAATTQTLRAELERDNLWTGQVVELEQLAQDHCIIDRLNQQMQADKSQQAAIAAGIKRVRVIETTGDELVAVKRTDVDIDSAEGRKMAYLDIRAHFTQGGGLRRGCGIAA